MGVVGFMQRFDGSCGVEYGLSGGVFFVCLFFFFLVCFVYMLEFMYATVKECLI